MGGRPCCREGGVAAGCCRTPGPACVGEARGWHGADTPRPGSVGVCLSPKLRCLGRGLLHKGTVRATGGPWVTPDVTDPGAVLSSPGSGDTVNGDAVPEATHSATRRGVVGALAPERGTGCLPPRRA